MSERIALAVVRPSGWHNPTFAYPAAVTRVAAPLWRARRGYKIHRPYHGMMYLHDRGRVSFTWYCGNSTNNPIPVTPECMDGLEPCVICEAKFQESR